MKKGIFAVFMFALMNISVVFAQEGKPVIGLSEINVQKGFSATVTGEWGRIVNYNSDGKKISEYPAEKVPTTESLLPMIRAAISQEIVNSGRFAVMERSADELNRIRQENLETSGAVNPNSQLDFMLTSELVQFSADRSNVSASKIFKIGLSIKFINISSGQIVVSETFSKETDNGGWFSSAKIKDLNDCAVALAHDLIGKIVEKIYPPIVLAINSKTGVIQISNAGFSIGDVIEVYSAGEPIIDPYTGKVIGNEEISVAQIVVFELNNQIAKAMADPKGEYTSAKIERGMNIRSTGTTSEKTVKNIKKVLKI
ncbi:hypothetical protein [Treponema sp.]|uniref:hypothetical protein n=1 Tax=Treponema sp. TaxID=166 RepID=UPI003F0A5664